MSTVLNPLDVAAVRQDFPLLSRVLHGKPVTYLDSANWNPDNLLQGQNGIAALTFCDVAIEPVP